MFLFPTVVIRLLLRVRRRKFPTVVTGLLFRVYEKFLTIQLLFAKSVHEWAVSSLRNSKKVIYYRWLQPTDDKSYPLSNELQPHYSFNNSIIFLPTV